MAISMSEAAAKRVSSVKAKRQTPNAWLRVGIRGGGCSGLSYFIDFVEEAGVKDKKFRFNGDVKVCVDRKSYLFLNGTEIDFESTLVKTGFIFHNPLASRSCSCGESFTI
jgi:iron-sulfur cluster assembly protein